MRCKKRSMQAILNHLYAAVNYFSLIYLFITCSNSTFTLLNAFSPIYVKLNLSIKSQKCMKFGIQKPFKNSYSRWYLQLENISKASFWSLSHLEGTLGSHFLSLLAVSRESGYFWIRAVDKIPSTNGHTWWNKVIWHAPDTQSTHWGVSHSIQN